MFSQAPLLPVSPQSTLCPRWDKLYEAAGEVARLRLSEQLYGLRRSRGGGEALHGAPGRRFPVLVPEKINSSGGGCNYSNYQHSPSYQQLVANQVSLVLGDVDHRDFNLLGGCESSFPLLTV